MLVLDIEQTWCQARSCSCSLKQIRVRIRAGAKPGAGHGAAAVTGANPGQDNRLDLEPEPGWDIEAKALPPHTYRTSPVCQVLLWAHRKGHMGAHTVQ